MASPYVPVNDGGKLRWLINFNRWFQTHGAAHGFSPVQLADMAAQTAAFTAAMGDHKNARAAARAATQNKNTVRTSAIALGRACARHLQSAPTMTDGERGAAGLTIPDLIPTPVNPDAILNIDPPLLFLDFSERRLVIVHWGPNPANERANARPAGTIGCQIHVARGGVPTTEAGWEIFESGTESPLVHRVKETMPTTFAYRACYIGKKLNFGPFSAPATCTVSV